MSWNFNIAGVIRDSASRRASDDRYYDSGALTLCEAVQPIPPHMVSMAVGEKTAFMADTYAADHVGELSGYDFVQVFTTGRVHGGGCSGGWFPLICERVTAYYGSVDVDVDGLPTTELRDPTTGDLRPILHPDPSTAPYTDGFFMRSTAHTWAGQDPANDANRSLWLPSEVIGVLGTVYITENMFDVSMFDVHLGCGVIGFNIDDGSTPPETDQPVICFV